MSETPKVPPYDNERFASFEEAADLLGAMVMGAIESGTQPPTPIFRWFCMHATYLFMTIEENMLLHSDAPSQEQEQEVIQSAVMVGTLLTHARKHKLLGLQNEIETALKTRKLRFPTTMDLTYNGLLP